MRNLKRSIAVLLCLAVLCAFAPMAVFAAETNAGKILNDAYALAKDTALNYDATLTGKITKINTPYDATYGNVSVTIEVPGYADKPMLCYRLKGTGADQLALGDTITVTGKIKNYNGTIEFDAGCTLDKLVKGENEAVVAPSDPKKIVDAAFALEKGGSLPYNCTLIGKITKIVSPYDSGYKNITVNIEVAGSNGNKTIECYRMKGEGAEALAVGDYIAVTGQLTRYYKAATEDKAEVDKIEFNSGCTFVKSAPPVDAPTDPKKIVDAAFALEKGASLPYTVSLTGKITAIVNPYSELYENITVNLEVTGSNGYKIIECYRMKGDRAPSLKVGDIITVTGILTRYYKAATEDKPVVDKIEFSAGCTFVFDNHSSDTCIIAGSSPLCGSLWDPTDSSNAMTFNGSVFEKVYKNVPAGDYQFKIVHNSTWIGINGNNVRFSVSAPCDVTITFNPATKTITYKGANVGKTPFHVNSIYVVGAAVAAAPGWLNGKNWDPAAEANQMTEVDPGVYGIIYANLPAGRYEFKFVANGSWDHSWGGAFTAFNQDADSVYNGDNIVFVLTEKKDVALFLDLSDFTPENGGAKFQIAMKDPGTAVLPKPGDGTGDILTGTESDFRVVGNADWMGNWDPASDAGRMLEVEPGVYQQIFTNVLPGCYELKITQNGSWDNSWGNNGQNVCFTATKTCDITVTFTLTETESTIRISGVGLIASNGDHEYARQLIHATCEQGSYYANVCILCGNMDPESASEELTPPLGHSYDAKVVSATCTQEGYTVHTCARCGDTYTGGTVPAFGHRFTGYISDGNATCDKDGTKSSTCRLCGEKKTTADPGSALGHSFTNYLDDYNAFCWRDGTKTARCDRCHATDTVTIPGSALPHTFDGGECIYCGAVENSAILGDISGDGKVNIGDVARLYAHIRGSAMLDEETLLACADLSGDGKVNIGDVARLYAQVRA